MDVWLLGLGALSVCALGYALLQRHIYRFKTVAMQDQLQAAKRETLEMSRLPLSNPYPMFQISKSGELIFANSAALETFPDVEEAGLNHHSLQGLNNPFEEKGQSVRELHHNGRIYDQSVSVSQVKGGEALIVYFYDITSRKQTERALEEARKEAEQARVAAEHAKEARGEFLANMSHELRTPMNGIIGLSDLLVEMNAPTEQQTLIEAVNSSAKNLLILLNDILDFSKIEAGELTMEEIAFSPRRVIRQIEALQSPVAQQKGLKLESVIDEHVPAALVGDPARLQQILNNLISNALKFTDDGFVRIRLSGHEEGEHFVMKLAVQDSGIGIPKEKQAKIFEKFQQADASTSRKYGGTGLGLSITRDLTRLMGGVIAIESEEGKGTTFTVTVPMRVGEVTEDHEEQEAQQLGGIDVSKRVLLVDDHPINLLFMRQAMRKLGFSRIDEATSGKQAVAMHQEHAYPLVLMDCQMPEMDGFEAAQAIRTIETDERAIILAVTADAMKGAEDRCKLAGMDDYISKPVDKEKLAGLLRKWVPGNVQVEKPCEDIVRSASEKDSVFDWSCVREFSEGDAETEKQLIQMFVQNLEQDLKALEDSFAADNFEAWDSWAHKLYGACAHIGAKSMAEVCDQAQSLSADEADRMGDLHQAILGEFRKVRDVLKGGVDT